MSTSDKSASRKQTDPIGGTQDGPWSNAGCLHCRLVDTIYAYFKDQGEEVQGETRLDMHTIAENIGQVLAEFFASEPDKRERDRRLKELFRATRDAIPGIRARGEGAFPRQVSLQ